MNRTIAFFIICILAIVIYKWKTKPVNLNETCPVNTTCNSTLESPVNGLTPPYEESTFGIHTFEAHDATGTLSGANGIDEVTLNTDKTTIYVYKGAESEGDANNAYYYMIVILQFTIGPAGVTCYQKGLVGGNAYLQYYSYTPYVSITDANGTVLTDGVTNIGLTSPTVYEGDDAQQDIVDEIKAGQLTIYLAQTLDSNGIYGDYTTSFEPAYSRTINSACNAIFEVQSWTSSEDYEAGLTFQIPSNFFDTSHNVCAPTNDDYMVSMDSQATFETLFTFRLDPSKVDEIKLRTAYEYTAHQYHTEDDFFWWDCIDDGNKASASPVKYWTGKVSLSDLTNFD